MKRFLILAIFVFLTLFGPSCTQVNPGTTQVGNPTISISKLESGTARIEIPLELLGNDENNLDETTIDITVNDAARNSGLTASDYYHDTTQEVIFDLTLLENGDELRFVLHLADGSSQAYAGTVSSLTDTEATEEDGEASAFNTDDFNFFATFEISGSALLEFEPAVFTDAEVSAASDLAGASVTAMLSDDEISFNIDAEDNFYEIADDSSLTGMVRESFSAGTINENDSLVFVATRTDASSREFLVDFGDISQSDTLTMSFVAFTGTSTATFSHNYTVVGSGDYTYSSACTVDFVRDNDFFINTSLSDEEIQDILDNGQANTYSNTSYRIAADSGMVNYLDLTGDNDYWDWVAVYNSDNSLTAARQIEIGSTIVQRDIYTGTVTETAVALDAEIMVSNGTDSCTVTFSLSGTVN